VLRDVINRRRLLFMLGGLGGVALLLRLLTHRAPSTTPSDNGPEQASQASEEEDDGASVLKLEVASADNQLAFDPTSLIAFADQQVDLTFHNSSTIFMHNWVLVNGDASVVDQVLQAAITAGVEHDYLPEDRSHILAHTALVSGGESATITFTTPATAGEYTYLCTFPGHCLAGMKGTLIITA
jgi:azurin